eukprot:Em0021g863a
MDEVVDYLKTLDYEKDFCKKLKFKPFSRYTGTILRCLPIPVSSSLPSLIWRLWLLGLCGKKLDQPQEFDDPNATVSSVISEAKSIGISTDFPPAKLKSGAGEYVCNLLCDLCQSALKATRFSWKRPVYGEETVQEEVINDDTAELSLSKMEEEAQDDVPDEDGEDEAVFLDISELKQNKQQENDVGGKMEGAMQPTFDAQEWRLEVERVLPALKIQVRQDNRDWRAHYEEMLQYREGIGSSLSETKVYLDGLHQEIAKTLEKISSREKYINNQLEHLIQDFRTSQDKLAEVKERHRGAGSSVTELARELAQVTEELEGVKAEMDEKGTSMTDAGPLVKIKQALTRLKNECVEMQVRTGVVEHTLLEAKFKSKSAMQQQMNAKTGDLY